MAGGPLPVAAVALDLDGTLLDTAEDLAEAANRMMRDLGLAPCPPESVRGWIGNGVDRLVKRCLTGDWSAEPDAAQFGRAVPIFKTHYREVLCATSAPYPGVMDGLAAMRSMGLKLACVTNKPSAFTLPLLEGTGLSPWLDAVVCGDQVARKKPDPEPYLRAAELLGVVPGEMLVIGDSVNDIVSARKAGCPVFAVPYGYNGGQDAAELGADAVVASLAEAAARIEKR